MKNKNKSKKIQQAISQMKQQAIASVDDRKRASVSAVTAEQKRKKEEEKKKKELEALMRSLGFDANKKKKKDEAAKKLDIYVDPRDQADAEKEETMEDWTQEKLEEVIQKKHSHEGKKMETTIVCRYFLDALEKRKYGWKWKCPNGDACIYRHCLPPGFILKMDALPDMNGNINEDRLEEIIEEKRKLITNGTPVTPATFAEWKRKRMEKRENKVNEEKETRAAANNNKEFSRMFGMSGRALFQFQPDAFIGDADEATPEE